MSIASRSGHAQEDYIGLLIQRRPLFFLSKTRVLQFRPRISQFDAGEDMKDHGADTTVEAGDDISSPEEDSSDGVEEDIDVNKKHVKHELSADAPEFVFGPVLHAELHADAPEFVYGAVPATHARGPNSQQRGLSSYGWNLLVSYFLFVFSDPWFRRAHGFAQKLAPPTKPRGDKSTQNRNEATTRLLFSAFQWFYANFRWQEYAVWFPGAKIEYEEV